MTTQNDQVGGFDATACSPAIGALSPWFGSKRNLAPRIVETLGKHTAYWEPFCGSLAVTLAKPQTAMETVNDLHGDLVNLARVVQHDELSIQLFSKLSRVACSESLHRDAAVRHRERGNYVLIVPPTISCVRGSGATG
jgi:site-specific DNA-adenine methylase